MRLEEVKGDKHAQSSRIHEKKRFERGFSSQELRKEGNFFNHFYWFLDHNFEGSMSVNWEKERNHENSEVESYDNKGTLASKIALISEFI